MFFLHFSCWQLIATVADLKLFSNLSLKWIFFQLLFKLLFTCQLKTSINPSNSKNNQKKTRLFFELSKSDVHGPVNLVKKTPLSVLFCDFCKLFQNCFFKEHLLRWACGSSPPWTLLETWCLVVKIIIIIAFLKK